MQPGTRRWIARFAVAMAVALLLVGAFALGPTRAASGPTLTYQVRPGAYDNRHQVAPNGKMAHPKTATGPDPSNHSQEDVYVIGANATAAAGCGRGNALIVMRSTPGIGVREIGRAIGREPSSVGYNVKALAREGLLRTDRDGLRVRCYLAETASA